MNYEFFQLVSDHLKLQRNDATFSLEVVGVITITVRLRDKHLKRPITKRR